MTQWRSDVMSAIADEAFQDQCFLWETGAPIHFLTIKMFYKHPHQYNTLKEWKKKNKKA